MAAQNSRQMQTQTDQKALQKLEKWSEREDSNPGLTRSRSGRSPTAGANHSEVQPRTKIHSF